MSRQILIVDDELHIVQVLAVKLKNAGYRVLTAVDGEEALTVATKEQPDVIITDFQMPYMTGVELCRALLDQPVTASIPVYILTARGYALDDDDLKLENIKEVLYKPFSPRAILGKVESLFADAVADPPVGRSEAA